MMDSSSPGAPSSSFRLRRSHRRSASMDSSFSDTSVVVTGAAGVGIPLYSSNGRVLPQKERESLARRRGICINCGIQTHSKTMMVVNSPLTNDNVYQGICIQCFPDKIPTEYVWSIRIKLATAEGTVSCSAPESLDVHNTNDYKGVYPSFGGGPSGKLLVEHSKDQHCPGFPKGSGTIQLMYDIPSGVQKNYHPHPGKRYDGKRIWTYLPDTLEGREILLRIKFAFVHGFMVKIGRSITTQLDHQTTFTDIPNKTSLQGGPFGFPDPRYLDVCHQKLDKVQIPNVAACLAYFESPTPAPASAPSPSSQQQQQQQQHQQQQQQQQEQEEPEIYLPSVLRMNDINSDAQQGVMDQNNKAESLSVDSDLTDDYYNNNENNNKNAELATARLGDGSSANNSAPLVRAELVFDEDGGNHGRSDNNPRQPKQQQQRAYLVTNKTLLQRIEALEEQVGIPPIASNDRNVAGSIPLTQRLDRVEFLILGQISETNQGRLLKDRLSNLEDHVF